MSKPSSKAPAIGFPEFAVRREAFDRYFDRPLPSSTFFDLVNKGKIVQMKGLRGFYLLNDSLRRLGLREVPALPESRKRSLEDILRLAFTLIDPDIFPAPPWTIFNEAIDAEVMDPPDCTRRSTGKRLIYWRVPRKSWLTSRAFSKPKP